MFLEKGSRPPVDMITPEGPQTLFLIFTHIPMVVFLIFAILNIMTRNDGALLAFLAGGAIAIFLEPIVDVLGFCYFPSKGQWTGLRAFERDIPIYMWAVYSWFVGGQGYLFYPRFRDRQCTKGRLWKLYGLLIVVNAVLELPGLLMGVYTYYGHQPFAVFGFPLWWPAVNAIMPITAGLAASVLVPHATAFGKLIILPLPAMADGAVNGAIAWPVWVSLSWDAGYSATYPAAGFSILLAVFFIWSITTQLPEELPHTAKGKRTA